MLHCLREPWSAEHTQLHEWFNVLAEQVIERAVEGDTSIAMPPMSDTYSAEDDRDVIAGKYEDSDLVNLWEEETGRNISDVYKRLVYQLRDEGRPASGCPTRHGVIVARAGWCMWRNS